MSDSSKQKNLVARGIDVGFGNTKYTLGFDPEGQDVKCGIFPSLAPSAGLGAIDGMIGGRNTVVVQAGGTNFEVGPDAMLAMTTNASRTMDIDFPLSDRYMALVLGALHYMDEPRIDQLVVGLPVSSYSALNEKVAARMVGKHQVGGGKEVEVVECTVVPQPVGGMWDFSVRHKEVEQFKESTCLLIDPGWFTMDWLMTKDLKVVSGRTNAANNAGMGAVLQAIGESLSSAMSARDGRAYQITEQILQRIDEGLAKGGEVKINGKIEQLNDHLEAGRRVMRDGMHKMLASIGSRSDIDNVIVVGGAATLYAPVICEVFGSGMVRVSHSPVFANVRGFQILATMKLRRSQAEAATASAVA